MHSISGPIEPEGALVDALIGLAAADVQALWTAGRAVPVPISVRALIDSGAEVTCVDPSVVAPLTAAGLQPGRYILTNMPAAGGLMAALEYTVSLELIHPSRAARANLHLRSHAAMELALRHLGYQVLVGRDVLGRCLLVYDGPGKRFTLAY
jgi:hypothetical protein